MPESMAVVSGFEAVRKRLDDLGFYQLLVPESLPLVEAILFELSKSKSEVKVQEERVNKKARLIRGMYTVNPYNYHVIVPLRKLSKARAICKATNQSTDWLYLSVISATVMALTHAPVLLLFQSSKSRRPVQTRQLLKKS